MKNLPFTAAPRKFTVPARNRGPGWIRSADGFFSNSSDAASANFGTTALYSFTRPNIPTRSADRSPLRLVQTKKASARHKRGRLVLRVSRLLSVLLSLSALGG